MAVYSAILVYVLDMFVITLTATTHDPLIATAALVAFLIGTAILLLGVWSAAREIRLSHRAVAHEAERNVAMGQ